MIKEYKDSSYYNNVVELYNEEELEEDYKQLSIDTIYEWFYKKSRKNNVDIELYVNNDINLNIKNIIDLLIVLPGDKKYGLIFVYDTFTQEEYDVIVKLLEDENITPFFLIGHSIIRYTPSYHISIPQCFQNIIDNNQVPVIINPVSQTLNYCVNNNYEFLFDTTRDDNSVITVSIDDCNFNPKTGFIFDGFNDYYKTFKDNVYRLQQEKLNLVEKKNKIIEKAESEEVRKHRTYYLIDKDLKRKDYYGMKKFNNTLNKNIYNEDNTINYGVLLRDLGDFDDNNECYNILHKIKYLQEDDVKNVNFWKVYLYYRIIVGHVDDQYDFVTIFQLVKYAARELVFTVSPAACLIHEFVEELVQSHYLEKKSDLEYVVIKENDTDNILEKYLD